LADPDQQAEEDRLERLVRAGTEELLTRVGTAFAGGADWAGGLRATAYELRDFLVEDEERARAMVLEAPRGNEATRQVREWGIEALAALIDLGRQELDDADAAPPHAAEITAGAILNRIHVGLEVGIETLDEEMVRELMFTAVLPYLGLKAALAELERPRHPAG